MKRGVSVVIPCYNSSPRLPETLSHIAKQKIPSSVNWEVIVIDNASTDNTAECAQQLWDSFNVNIPFRVVEQPIPGLSAARRKGFESANYEYIIFCDDDNWLQEDYVRLAYDIMESNQEIAALGGRGVAECESKPSEWFYDFQQYYAVGPQNEYSGDITERKGYIYGAGSVIRKSAWMNLMEKNFSFLLTDRKGASLSSSGDSELCYALRLLGYKIWYDERLTFKHFITKKRLSWEYFLKLVSGANESAAINKAYRHALSADGFTREHPSRFFWIKESINTGKNILRNYRSIRRLKTEEREGHPALKNYHQQIGRLRGWLKIRSKFLQIIEKNRQIKT